jgi:hypothetical protein
MLRAMNPSLTGPDMAVYPVLRLDLKAVLELDDEDFYQLAKTNPELRLERSSQGGISQKQSHSVAPHRV